MKRYIANSSVDSRFDYENTLSDRPYMPGEGYDTWGEIQCVDDTSGIGVEYNLCIDDTYDGAPENCSAFYVMYYNPSEDYWETDYSDFEHYEIDFDSPSWRSDVKAFAYDMLSRVIARG